MSKPAAMTLLSGALGSFLALRGLFSCTLTVHSGTIAPLKPLPEGGSAGGAVSVTQQQQWCSRCRSTWHGLVAPATSQPSSGDSALPHINFASASHTLFFPSGLESCCREIKAKQMQPFSVSSPAQHVTPRLGCKRWFCPSLLQSSAFLADFLLAAQW